MADTPAHEQTETLHVREDYPEHIERATASTAEFDANKHRLLNKMGLPCWKCRATEKLEIHHFIIEWSAWNDADPAKVRQVMHGFDPYGFSADEAKNGDALPASPDDIRNLMVLCQTCHRGAGFGIHLVPVPLWFADLVKKDGTVFLEPAK